MLEVCASLEFLQSRNLIAQGKILIWATAMFMGFSVPSYMFSKSNPGIHLANPHSIMVL